MLQLIDFLYAAVLLYRLISNENFVDFFGLCDLSILEPVLGLNSQPKSFYLLGIFILIVEFGKIVFI